MRIGLSIVAPLLLVAIGVASSVAACSGAAKRNQFDTAGDDAGFDGSGPLSGPTACAGLACKQVPCDDGSTTTLTGKVYDPAGTNALYNVMVYVPAGPDGNAPLPDLTQGASCNTCASVALNPLVSTLTDTSGAFTLTNVPVDKDVPVVVQVGKWRRKLTIDITQKCQENKVPDKQFRLPKNGTEGDMPQIAVTAGAYDALECLVRGIGVDDAEFVAGTDPSGHVHMYQGYGGVGIPGSPPAGGTAAAPFGGELWNDVTKMAPYDMVLLSCEGDEYLDNKGGAAGRPGARQAMWDYANLGGRIFATHYHYVWFKDSPQPDWQALASWGDSSDATETYDVDQTFPKGAALAEWLMAVNASSSLGKIELTDVTGSLTAVHPPAQGWIEQASKVRYFSFNAPTAADESAQCGRAVYSDLHLMGESAGGETFPSGCPAPGGLSAQQKALEFMFFDLSGCIQSDDTPPTPPH